MGDVEDVQLIADRVDMNPREMARYELHITDIKRHSKKVAFWWLTNTIWQIIFFWGLVILAIVTAEVYADKYASALVPMFEFLNDIAGPMNLMVAIVGPFSFFLMIWSGVVRRKWEGKLTRSSAYCLAFLSNIEHREFMEMEGRDDKFRALVQEKTEEKKVKDKLKMEREKELQDKILALKQAHDSGKISDRAYEKNLKKLEKEYH